MTLGFSSSTVGYKSINTGRLLTPPHFDLVVDVYPFASFSHKLKINKFYHESPQETVASLLLITTTPSRTFTPSS
jgi:hypothetical protein